MKSVLIFMVALLIFSCNKKAAQSDLEQFISENSGKSEDYLIACAAGNLDAFMGNSDRPIRIFFYNVDGASSATLYVKSNEGEKEEYRYYSRVDEAAETLFNGRMGFFSVSNNLAGKWVIVSYTSESNYHVSDPILLRADTHPTVDISNKIVFEGDSLQPEFNWHADPVKGNVIYFSLISNSADDFVSGVYTTEKNWNFYDVSNVVLNVTPTSNPTLNAQESYVYTNMGVGKDNWVRTFGTKLF